MPLCLSCTFLKLHARLDFGPPRSATTNKLGCFLKRNAWVSKDATIRQHSIAFQSFSERDNSGLR
jgi:hypothetical protein